MANKIERLSSIYLPKPHFRYCPIIKAGPFYKTAGMVAIDITSNKLIQGDVELQTL